LKQNEVVLFTFPDFILQAGFGVRVWPIEGVNSQSDLFGAQRIISNMEENYITFDLYDPLGNRFTSYFKSVVP
jgi:hypothetical protein